MWEMFQGSATKTTLSIAMAACVLMGGADRGVAGDKIEFSAPGNPAISQKPERETKNDDSLGSLISFGNGINGLKGRRYSIPRTETIIIPAQKKQTGWRAWDSGMNPANLRDGKELSEEGDNAPTQNNATPTNSAAAAAADWEANYNAPRPERSPGFAAQRVVTPSSGSYQPPGTSQYRTGGSSSTVWSREEATAPNISSIDKSTDGGLMSAWGRGLATSGAGSTSTYSELMREQHRSMYNAPAPDIGGAGPLSQLPAAATGNGGNASAGSPAGSSGWEPAAPLLSKASDSYGASSASSYNIYRPNGSVATPGQTPARPAAYANPFGGGAQAASSHPAILPFPAKPGSVLR